MKMTLIIACALFLAAGTGLAGFITEGFETTAFPPNGWSTVLNGNSPILSRTTLCSGYGSGTASVRADFYNISSGNEELVTFTFMPSAAGDSLIFDHAYAAYSSSYIDSLRISTSPDGGGSWSVLVDLPGGPSGPLNTGGTTTSQFVPNAGQWATKRYALPVGTNKVKFIAISDYGNELYVDNIRITGLMAAHDVGCCAVVAPDLYQSTTVSPQISVMNYGQSTESFNVTCRIDSIGGVQVYSQSASVSDLAPGAIATASFPDWTPAAGEIFNIYAWAELAGDEVAGNDSVHSISYSYITPRNVMGELFTSTTCAPCVSANSTLNGLYPTWRDSMVLVRYHMNWPSPGNDPFYAANPTENTAKRTYYGINAVPNFVINGKNYGSSSSSFASILSNERKKLSPIDMTMTGHYDSSANTGRVTVTLTATGRIEDTNLRLRYAVIDDTVNYTGTNGDPVHHQVMRDLFPSADGQPITISLGETVVDSQDFAFNPSWPYTTKRRLYVIAFLQGNNSKNVWQAARVSYWDLLTGVAGGPAPEPLAGTALLPARPNPAPGKAAISYQLGASAEVNLSIYNVAGQLVRTLVDGQAAAGPHTLQWDGLDNAGKPVANGVYAYRLSAGGFSSTRKLTIVR